MTDNAADGRAITEIQMGAAAAPEPTVVVAATLADAAGLAEVVYGAAKGVPGAQRHAGHATHCRRSTGVPGAPSGRSAGCQWAR